MFFGVVASLPPLSLHLWWATHSLHFQYLDGISVPEDAVSAPNPLLVVNGRINMAAPDLGGEGEARARQIASIEANHMVSTGRVNTRVGL